MKKFLFSFAFLLLVTSAAFGQANGKLQLHFLDVGQGDAAILISPNGQVAMFDNGVSGHCDSTVAYLRQLGVTKIDYHIASHYHDDHIGCTQEALNNFPLQIAAYDRGSSYSSQTYTRYLTTIGNKRMTATPGDKITLDSATGNPVDIEFVASNGAGVSTTNENDLSLVAVIRFGQFDAVMGGDLSGFNDGSYKDIETTVANSVGQVEVYKVHHHGSEYSTNAYLLSVVKPKMGVISAGSNNSYNHPTAECLGRIHNVGVKTYWTTSGGGVIPNPAWDVAGGNIVIETTANSDAFLVTYNNGSKVDSYQVWGASTPACTYTISPASYGVSPSGHTGTITVIPSSSSCSWTTASNDSWITITSGNGGMGNGTVTYSVAANAMGSHREGTMVIGGQTLTIHQAKDTFTDDPNNVFTPYIYALYTEGITVGCGGGNYCPAMNVTRGQMAAFIIRSLYGETFDYSATPYFGDVPSDHNFFKYVQKLKDQGITTTIGTYMVNDIVTREQMAAFIIRSIFGESFGYTSTPYFTDVPAASVFFKYIQRLKDQGITSLSGIYMAPNYVSRDQMAAFIGRAFLDME